MTDEERTKALRLARAIAPTSRSTTSRRSSRASSRTTSSTSSRRSSTRAGPLPEPGEPGGHTTTNFYDRAVVDIIVRGKAHVRSKIW
jgi:hypothetical protein